ncbi:MAG: methionyl-tRNA formyltransferase [Planctomycetaceae bacterium]
MPPATKPPSTADTMALRIVLLGTGEFALPTFRALIEGDQHEVVAVYTQPDRSGRGHHRHVNPVKALAEAHGIPVLQPEKVNTQESLAQLKDFHADLFLVAAYGQILKPDFLAIPPLGAFNLHGSLLPRHRGAAPVQYSIWKGDRQAGVTMFRIEPALDSGPMVAKTATDIMPGETSGDLMLRLAELSVPLTITALQQLEAGTAVFEVQDAAQVTLAPKIQKEDGLIDWNQSATEIVCQIQAMQPWPKASSWLHTPDRPALRCLFLSAKAVSAEAHHFPGTVKIDSRSLLVHAGAGQLKILSIQPEGKKAMEAESFLNGYGISSQCTFRRSE